MQIADTLDCSRFGGNERSGPLKRSGESAIAHAKRLSGYDVSMGAAMFSAVTTSERKTDGFITEGAGDHQSSL